MGTLRDTAHNRVIDLPRERDKDMYSDGFVSHIRRQMSNFSPIAAELIEVFTEDRGRRKENKQSVPAE